MSVLFFMDSGLGGLPYLQWIRRKRPNDEIIYLADNAGFPYGGRSPEFLRERLTTISRYIIDRYNPELMVIACNTASVTSLDVLRNRFTVPFVGVVPAVKPAAENNGDGVIGVLATERTVKGEYLQALIRQFALDQDVETLGAPDLVDFIENRFFVTDDEAIFSILEPYLIHIETHGWSTLVLGCTHFILLRPWLERWLPSSVNIVDSTEGVGRRILSLLDTIESAADSSVPAPVKTETGTGVFHITGTGYNVDVYKAAARRYGLDFAALEEIE
ncbi:MULTISPECIES: glutamate racemase [unclassified Oceanispirochaeta]|uniref:glutamate racemase n=1 Tax=unclassified Oceanispirochaeta TaxID=2635722 RepID=UPI000E093FB0|nr:MULTISPECIES: glutamate racemase [unclassified Oceanispirochaeta]MBF9015038.1 glutamate racemase [Oceanispirochaeta sp. M2]NPD71496.1 glutamate racemase [Oceanispirochaeta sp. M1]RDG33071.1 glutamate racemase [Oceanispirochaeta sp. M1]